MIAILLATYNGDKYLREQLESIRLQTYDDIKCFIHDDGSLDNTAEIIDEYCEKYSDKFVLIEGAPTGGSKENFLYLLSQVEAQYYMFCDQDDVWNINKVKILKEEIDRLEEGNDHIPTMVFSDMTVVDEQLRVICDSFIYYDNLDTRHLEFNRLICQNVVAGCTALFNKRLRDLGLTYKNIDNIRWHDWWLALIASGKGKIKYVDKSLSLYRQHMNNSIGAQSERGYTKILQSIVWLVTLSHIKETKKRINYFVTQARELDDIELSKENKKIVRVMKEFDNMNKIEKIRAFRRFRIIRNKRNLWQLICL